MQTNKAVEKFSKSKEYDPEGQAIRKRRKKVANKGHDKFKDRFFRVTDPIKTENLY